MLRALGWQLAEMTLCSTHWLTGLERHLTNPTELLASVEMSFEAIHLMVIH